MDHQSHLTQSSRPLTEQDKEKENDFNNEPIKKIWKHNNVI